MTVPSTTRARWALSASNLLIPIVLSLLVASVLLILAGANPLDAFAQIVRGSVGSKAKLADTLMAWAPLVLAAAGLVVTFTAGMWNIGVEGQVVAGAIAATAVARIESLPGPVAILGALAAGVVGGAVWALLAALLKTKGGVNEIFGGLGLTFVAQGLAIYLIIGPWQRAGVASTSGTDLFPETAWLPRILGTRLSLVAIVLAVAATIAVYLLLRGTYFGLRLKATGNNPSSARLMGIATTTHIVAAFGIGGGLAGLAGAIQATGFHHKLVPAVSGGYGYLGILVALLAAYSAKWIGPIAFFFAMVTVGATQLQLRLDLDSSLGGIIQGVLVLFVLLVGGYRRLAVRRRAQGGSP